MQVLLVAVGAFVLLGGAAAAGAIAMVLFSGTTSSTPSTPTGTGPSNSARILGKWVDTKNEFLQLEFLPDGQVRIVAGFERHSGSYSFLPDGRLSISPGRSKPNLLPWVMKLYFEADHLLTTVDDDGGTKRWIRMK